MQNGAYLIDLRKIANTSYVSCGPICGDLKECSWVTIRGAKINPDTTVESKLSHEIGTD